MPAAKPKKTPAKRAKRLYRMQAQAQIIRYMDQQERLMIARESIPIEKLVQRLTRVAMGHLAVTTASMRAMTVLLDKALPDLQNITLDAVRRRSDVKTMTDDQLDLLIASAPDVIDVDSDTRTFTTIETAPHR